MLEVRDLCVSYGKHQALDGAALHVAAGEIVVILGANGAGKSTLLKAVSGVCEGRVDGSVSLSGHPLEGMSADQIVEEGIALVPEGRGIFGDLTVEENLRLGAYPERARHEEAANLERVFALFPKLVERRRQIVRTMSGGEQQMVAIGRAMMSAPEILTLDEPSLGLSPLLCKELFQTLRAVRDLGIGVLMVEQNAKQSLAIADRGYLLENTRIVHEESAAALMTDPAVQAAYLGGGAGRAGRPGAAAQPRPAAKPVDTVLPKPAIVAVSPTSGTRLSAETLAGLNMDDLLAKAEAVAKAARTDPVGSPLDGRNGTENGAASDAGIGTGSGPGTSDGHGTRTGPPGAGGDIQAMLKEFELAAARAGRAKPLPRHTPAIPPAPAAPGSDEKPVTIEVYRAPRVEIYKRRPGGGFERT
ncbi:MAG: ABC transporter ATP-binding protein [Pseudomonadota bacterium]